MTFRLLIVDLDWGRRALLKEMLEVDGYAVFEASSLHEGISLFQAEPVDLVLVDLGLEEGGGFELMRRVQAQRAETPIVALASGSQVDAAVSAMKRGAVDCLVSPVTTAALLSAVRQGLERNAVTRARLSRLSVRKARFGLANLPGHSAPVLRLKEQIKKLAMNESTPVLIVGEPGTGKNVVARAVHYESSRVDQAFLEVSCRAVPETLLEVEIFGYEKGGYAASGGGKQGLLEHAAGGTLHFDEIASTPAGLQARLAEMLETQQYRRIGGREDRALEARLIFSTRCELRELVERGQFHEALYYGMSVVQITVPPLRERSEDIADLAAHFLYEAGGTAARNRGTLDEAAVEKLREYSWPGNVRELRNVLEHASEGLAGELIRAEHLVLGRGGSRPRAAVALPPEGCALEEVERSLVEQALERTGGNQTRAAQLLGISRDQMRYRMKKFGLIFGGDND